jgi:hypothetical protein
MNLFKFNDFLNEVVMIPVLDCVIDDSGNIYNGKVEKYPLRKGNIEKAKVDGKTKVAGIIGHDGIKYLAGIDKNGQLVAPDKNIENGYLVDADGNQIRVPSYITTTKSRFWKFYDTVKLPDGTQQEGPQYDYSKLIPILATGWVNTKVDMEVVKKVRRYSRGLGTGSGRDGFVMKLSELQNLSQGIEKRKRSRRTIQKEMSAIMLLHYINEIKDFFTPASAGFLFESFLGGMIKNSKIVEDNSKADIRADGETWQIKLYDSLSSSISVAYLDSEQAKLEKREPKIPVDHFVICLKFADRIEITVLRGIDDEKDPLCYKNFLTPGGQFSAANIKATPYKYSLYLMGIEQRIEDIADGLKQAIDDVYADLSSFQYNIESIITGVDEQGKLLNEKKFDDVYNKSVDIAKGLDVKITSLYRSIKND